MSAAPLVTIVIPVFNGGYFLRLAIESALAQSWSNREVLVVDDGSTDDGETRRTAESFGERIRYIHKPNGGVGSALNRGVEEMRGEFFSWLSHDDLYHPYKLEAQMKVMLRQPEPVIVFGDYECMNADATFLSRTLVGARHESDKPLWAVLEGRINGLSLLIPKACFDRCGLFKPGKFQTQDYDLWFRFAHAYPFVHAPGALVRYRVHPAQDSQTPRHVDEASLLWMEMLEGLNPAIMRAYEGSELAFLIRAGDFVKLTGYRGAQQGVPRLVSRAARDHPLGVVLVVQDRREAEAALAALRATDLNLELVIVDAAASALDTLAVTAPGLIEDVVYLRVLDNGSLRRIVEVATARLETELVAFVPGDLVVNAVWLRDAYERLVRFTSLDGLLSDRGAGAPLPPLGTLGVLGGAVVRRAALATALRWCAGPDSSFEHALGITANLRLEPASAVGPAAGFLQ